MFPENDALGPSAVRHIIIVLSCLYLCRFPRFILVSSARVLVPFHFRCVLACAGGLVQVPVLTWLHRTSL